MKQLFRTLTLCVLPLLVAACNTDYNFDNVSLEVTVGNTNGIAVPLGEIEQITLGELLEEAGFETGEDGFYGFDYGDSFEYTAEVAALPSIAGLVPEIDPISNSFLGGFNAAIDTFYGKKDLAFPSGLEGNFTVTDAIIGLIGNSFDLHYDPHTFEESFEIELPEQVASLETVTFGADGNGSVIDLQFDLGGLGAISESCHIETLYFELPAGFTIDKLPNDPIANYITISKGAGSDTYNHFQISNYTMTGSHLTVNVVIKSVDLGHISIGESRKVIITEDVTFELDATVQIKAGTIPAISPYMEMSVTPQIYDATITTNRVSHSMSFKESIQQEIEIPDIVTRIDYLSIVNANDHTASPCFSVDIKLEDAPIERLELQDVEITLPEFLDIEAPEGWTYNAGVLRKGVVEILNDQTNHIIDLTLNGINSLDIVDQKITLDSQIGMSATAVVTEGTELHISTAAKSLTLTPMVNLDDMTIKEVTGLIDPDLNEMMPTQEISLGDLTSSIENIELDLKIESPLLSVTVENPIGVGIDATLTLIAYKGEQEAMTVTTPQLSILPEATTTFNIVGDAERVPAGVSYTLIPELSELIALLPDRIVVSLAAETNKDTAHTLELKDSYTFKVDYAVEAAFKFDAEQDGSIDYTVMVEDVDLAALADIDLIVESLILKVASQSTLPIDLTMDIELLDESGAPIQSITSSTEGKIAGSTSDEANLSECDIILTIAQPSESSSALSPWADIARTKKIRCQLHGTTLAGGGLKPEQYISAKLSLLLDKGITIDLGSFLPDEEDSETPTEE